MSTHIHAREYKFLLALDTAIYIYTCIYTYNIIYIYIYIYIYYGIGLNGCGKSALVGALGGSQFCMPTQVEKQKYGISAPCIFMLGGDDQAKARRIRHVQGLGEEVRVHFSCSSR
jgi:hypothetical protein